MVVKPLLVPCHSHNSDVHKLLLNLAPGVFLASAAYSNQVSDSELS